MGDQVAMMGRLKVTIAAAAVAGMVASAGPVSAAAERGADDVPRGIDNFLTENTLAYPDEKGERNLIHFGRFGNFDWYYPCEFESGYWSLGSDMVLSLTYDNPRFAPRQYRLEQREDGVAMTERTSGRIAVAELLEGSHIPFF